MASNRLLPFAVFVTAFAVICSAKEGPTEFQIEKPCSSAGGMCVLKEECPVVIAKEYLGLCPDQQSKGAECCHGISTKEYRCQKLGGECFPNSEACEEVMRISRATDCAKDKTCCLLI